MTTNNTEYSLVFTADIFCARIELIVICIPLPETIAVAQKTIWIMGNIPFASATSTAC